MVYSDDNKSNLFADIKDKSVSKFFFTIYFWFSLCFWLSNTIINAN